jgi:pimeloyl-ACP methyl ester carboxylesterase
LILETPFYSGLALARHFFPIYPVSWLAKYSFPSNQYIQNVAAPVTIFHGNNDEVIPYGQSKRLLREIRSNGELVTIGKGKHNDLRDFPLFHEKLDSVLKL